MLPCRDQGLAGAYCGRHHRPDVHMHRRRRRRRIQGILVHPGSQPGWSCQSSKAQWPGGGSMQCVLVKQRSLFPDISFVWLSVAPRVAISMIFSAEIYLCVAFILLFTCVWYSYSYSLVRGIHTRIQLCVAVFGIRGHHLAPWLHNTTTIPRLWLRPHKIPPSSRAHLLTLKHSSSDQNIIICICKLFGLIQ